MRNNRTCIFIVLATLDSHNDNTYLQAYVAIAVTKPVSPYKVSILTSLVLTPVGR